MIGHLVIDGVGHRLPLQNITLSGCQIGWLQSRAALPHGWKFDGI
jgi:hypothetical protein